MAVDGNDTVTKPISSSPELLRVSPPSSATNTRSPIRRRNSAYLVEMRDLYHGRTPLVLRPGSVEEVAAILKLANETKTAIVPQGGNTGLVGGQVPLNGEICYRSRGSTRSARSTRCPTP